ncbi:hypothetical protein H1P_1020003 [Hyella patelloides LEGE 07179]|uniref:Uncharacterized protein n=1 Tax=Hyella patelloides LEGE 07179 TaxID=945734 RepID=A0A563VIX1_9CYAN|nr:hypothetical protein H1P_1020003 [Hyella patelloides LEGE 07179]
MAATIYSEKIYLSIMSQKKAIALKKQQREQNNFYGYNYYTI